MSSVILQIFVVWESANREMRQKTEVSFHQGERICSKNGRRPVALVLVYATEEHYFRCVFCVYIRSMR